MKKVVVIISSYNGEKNIVRQLDSIFEQEDVLTSVYIRDDRSTDNTINVLNQYMLEHPTYNIVIEQGDNLGYAKSFWTALKNCQDADYYAFSDQDDVWMPDKLIKCINAMEKDDEDVPKLSYCKMIRSDENLMPLLEQVKLIPYEKITKKIALTKTYNYGAATLINVQARSLICRIWPSVYDLPHDLWAGLLCFWFGKVYFVDEDLYYWIRYSTSVTGEGTLKTGIIYRIKRTLDGKSYVNIASYLLEYYGDLLTPIEKRFLERIENYKKRLSDRMYLIFDPNFCRDSFWGTIALKIGILFGWY